MELNPLQLMIVGAVASILAQVLKLLAAKFSQRILDEKVVTVIVLAVSFALGAAYVWPKLDFNASGALEVAQKLVEAMSTVAGMAWVVYKLLLEQLSEKVNLSQVFMLSPTIEEDE